MVGHEHSIELDLFIDDEGFYLVKVKMILVEARMRKCV